MPGNAKDVLGRLAAAVYPLYSQLITRARALEGEPAHGGEPMRCLFVGSTDFNRYFESRIFAAPPRLLWSTRTSLSRARSLVAASTGAVDLCVANVPARHATRFADGADFRTDPMVCQHIEVDSPWARQRNAPRRAARQAQKEGFTRSVSTDPDDCRWFYERMYRPHARAQFGDLAYISPLADLQKRMKQGYIVFVNAGGERIAGTLDYVEGDTVTGYKVGVLDGDRRIVERGAVAAVYLFSLEVARARGCRRVDLESSRPILDDGAYVYKRLWGAAVRRSSRVPSSLSFFFVNRKAEFVAPFLAKHPLIVAAPGGFGGVLGVPSASALDPAREAALRKQHYSPGLCGLTIVTGRLEEARTIPF